MVRPFYVSAAVMAFREARADIGKQTLPNVLGCGCFLSDWPGFAWAAFYGLEDWTAFFFRLDLRFECRERLMKFGLSDGLMLSFFTPACQRVCYLSYSKFVSSSRTLRATVAL